MLPPSQGHPHAQSQSLPPPLHTGNTNDNADGTGDGQGHDNPETHRYSYLPTPVEYQAPFSSSRPQPPLNPIADPAPTTTDSLSSPSHLRRHHHHVDGSPPSSSATPVVEEPSPSPQTATTPRAPIPSSFQPDPNNPPPLSEHPANFAPYADASEPMRSGAQAAPHPAPPPFRPPRQIVTPTPPPALQTHTTTTTTTTTTGPATTNTPRPSTAEVQQLRREKEWGVVPDDNPLSPTTTQAAQGRLGRSHIAAYQSKSHLPGQIMHPNQQVKGGTWSHGLCDCKDVGACCTGLFCPCILYGRTQYRLSMKSEKKDPTNLLGYETCNASCTVMALLCGCQWLLATIQHSRIRHAYEIPGSIPSDCVRATCCTCCTLIQDEREIKLREETARQVAGVSGNVVSLPYATPGNMSFSPPPR
ncbi:hypothetical protein VTO42DRAFT_4104 [Malbranchea cinnamomea]